MICTLNVFSQVEAKSKTVLKDFILGYDSEQTLLKKGIIFNEKTATQFTENVIIVRLWKYDYLKDVTLVLVDNTLYSVRYYVYTTNQYERYKNKLYKTYNVLHYQGEYSWFNKYITIKYDLGEDNEPESFVHYDAKLLEKYPQYKDF